MNKVSGLLSITTADIVGAGITAIFWFILAALMLPEEYGQIHYFMGIADIIVDEPNGAAHIDPISTANELKKDILNEYSKLKQFSSKELINNRIEKYDTMGKWKIDNV